MDKRILFDEEDRELIESRHWGIQTVRSGIGYVRSGNVLLHRAIMGFPKGLEVDHINGNVLDNRKSNLRICTKSQNRANKFKYKNNKSGYKGVYFETSNQKWRAVLHYENKRYALGRFDTALEAAIAYNAESLRIHGEFGRLNILT